MSVWRGACSLSVMALFVSCAHNSATQPAPEKRVESSQAPAWGEPVEDRATEQSVAAALHELGTAGPNRAALVDSMVVVGPALWEAMSTVDTKLANAGTPSTAVFTAGGVQHSMPMRTFLGAEAVASLNQSTALQRLSLNFSSGTARPATARERETFYTLIPFEIAGKPVTVVEKNGNCLLVMLEDGKITWLDMISAYRTK